MRMIKRGSRKAQVTIFIIIAIVIVAVLLILLYPRLKIYISPSTPSLYMDECVKKELGVIGTMTKQGGVLEPENFISYLGEKIEYLCYTAEYLKTCTMQQPFVRKNFENELANYLKNKAESCIQELVRNYQSRGYTANAGKSSVSVEIVPRSIRIIVNAPVTISKEAVQSFERFTVVESSNLYDLLSVSESILNWEAHYGDSAPEAYMMYYPDLKIQKLKQGDGSKIYILENRVSGDKFTFATRSLSWPAGYNTPGETVR